MKRSCWRPPGLIAARCGGPQALPANAKIAKDAKETIQECVSEFISFITSE